MKEWSLALNQEFSTQQHSLPNSKSSQDGVWFDKGPGVFMNLLLCSYWWWNWLGVTDATLIIMENSCTAFCSWHPLQPQHNDSGWGTNKVRHFFLGSFVLVESWWRCTPSLHTWLFLQLVKCFRVSGCEFLVTGYPFSGCSWNYSSLNPVPIIQLPWDLGNAWLADFLDNRRIFLLISEHIFTVIFRCYMHQNIL